MIILEELLEMDFYFYLLVEKGRQIVIVSEKMVLKIDV